MSSTNSGSQKILCSFLLERKVCKLVPFSLGLPKCQFCPYKGSGRHFLLALVFKTHRKLHLDLGLCLGDMETGALKHRAASGGAARL